jgi:hypothetical protein
MSFPQMFPFCMFLTLSLELKSCRISLLVLYTQTVPKTVVGKSRVRDTFTDRRRLCKGKVFNFAPGFHTGRPIVYRSSSHGKI